MLKNLKKKFILTNMLLVGIVLLVVFISICSNTYNLQMEEVNRTLKAPIGKDMDKDKEKFGFMTSMVVIVDENQEISDVISRGATLDQRSLEDLIGEVTEEDTMKGRIEKYNLFYERTELDSGMEVVAFVDSSRMEEAVKGIITLSIVSFFFSMIIIFFISKFIANLAIKPVEKSWEQQKQFVADASHELKTPLTVILANNDILKSKKDATVGEEVQWIDSTLEEAKHMKKLVEDMLFLAKNDAIELRGDINNISLSELIEADVLQFEPVAYEGGVELTSDIEKEISTIADGKQIKQLMHILLDNSIKYARPIEGEETSKVHVKLKKEQGIVLTVQNTGDIIPEEQKGHLFDRFYRGDSARTRLTTLGEIDSGDDELGGGYGLGLAIAKTIVENHKGTIEVESNQISGPDQTQGTIFTIKFV